MKWLHVILILLVMWAIAVPVNAVTTVLNSAQIGASVSNGYVAVTDGTDTTWTDPATLASATDLDDAYDNGDTVDYSSGNGAVKLDFPNGGTTDAWQGLNVMNALVEADSNNTSDVMFGFEMIETDTKASNIFMSFVLDNFGGADEKILEIIEGGTRFFDDDASNFVNFGAAGTTTEDYSMKIPPDSGDATEAWVTDGSGGGSWDSYQVSEFDGYQMGLILPAVDGYIDIDASGTYAFVGSGVNDIRGYGIPWGGSIIGIQANYQFSDADDVATIDVYPREDGSNIAAACKLTLAETGLNRDSATVTFTHGTHEFAADQTLGIYIDVIGDTTGPNSVLTDLIVTVYYRYRL